MTLRGGGDAGFNGGPAGDLNITVSVRPHPIFEREGFDIFCEVPITYAQATLGGEITVPTLDGKAKFSIHEGTQPGDEFKLRGKGIKRLNYSGYGDEYVKIIVEVPRDLNKEQRAKLLEFEKSLTDSNHKKRKTFFDKVKELFGE